MTIVHLRLGMLRLSEIKTGNKIVIVEKEMLCFAEVAKVEGELIYTTDGGVWNRDDGTRAFWQLHRSDGRISQDPKQWEWLASTHERIEADEKRHKRKDDWLKHHKLGQKKKSRQANRLS